jgi:hypothetical protein
MEKNVIKIPFIPQGTFNSDDPIQQKKDELRKRREAVFKRMTEQKDVSIDKDTRVNANPSEGLNNPNGGLIIPKGILNIEFHWYERDPELLKAEVEMMKKFFPYFKLEKLDDGKFCWIGDIRTGLIGNNSFNIMLVYDNDHPNNKSYGGSVKVYLIDPSLEELEKDLGVTLPHTIKGNNGHRYLCTSDPKDFIVTESASMSAASCLAWAVKWIVLCEGLIAGDEAASLEKFSAHIY